MKIKIKSGFSGVISTGSYENMRPSFEAEIEQEMGEEQILNAAKIINKTQQELQKICYDNFKSVEQQGIVERINKERQDVRFYLSPAGENYPSVTSIINWDADFFVSAQQLAQYAAQGNLYDLQAKHFIQSGIWEPVEKIEGSWADLVILKKGDLQLSCNGWDFPAFLKKYPVEKMEIGRAVFSAKHKFAGTSDIRICYYEGKKTLADIKRTPDKLKHFKQCAAYIMAEEESGESPYEQMMLIPANDETKQGFSKPVITTEINQYKAMFLKDRENFKKRFGV